ncbi:hypothetical protein D8B26_001047 [Coccidioides posadasii str. Silveira]|nr:hypothetical protein D8B26_001047 [Coccidioides posadasii str. Silveira]
MLTCPALQGHNSQLGSSTPSNLLHPAATSHHLSPLKPAPSRIRDDADDGQKSDSDACHPARPQPQHKRAAANTASAGRSSKATGVTVAPGAGEESRGGVGDNNEAIPIHGLLMFHACPSRPFYTVSFVCDDATSPRPDTEDTEAAATGTAHFSQKQPPTIPRYPRVEVVIPTSRHARDPPILDAAEHELSAPHAKWRRVSLRPSTRHNYHQSTMSTVSIK